MEDGIKTFCSEVASNKLSIPINYTNYETYLLFIILLKEVIFLI